MTEQQTTMDSRNIRTVNVEIPLWKALSKTKLNEGHKSLSDLIKVLYVNYKKQKKEKGSYSD